MMRSFRDGFAGKTTLIENSAFHKAKFRQWQQGLSVAKGDLVWITDANDWNEPDFLSKLVPALQDESVLLAYSNTIFMTDDGSRARSTLSEVLQDLDPNLWREDFTRTAHHLVRDVWAKRNIVPTPSSAIFRRQSGAAKVASGDEALQWADMVRCGDWLCYLNAAKGGRVHFASDVTTFCCLGDPVSEFSADDDLSGQSEREAIANYCSEVYKTGAADAVTKRMPSILMVGRAFTANVHDTFPILLANTLRRGGYTVTYLCCHREPAHDGVRMLLNTDIPVLDNLKQLNEIVTDFGIDIVHTHHPEIDQEILSALQSQTQCARAVTLHGDYRIMQPDKRQTAVRNLERQADALICASDQSLSPFREAGLQHSSKLHHIAGILDDAPFEPIARSRLNVPIEAFVLCLASPSAPPTGWTEAILAVERARKQSNLDIRLLLIGAGPEAECLRATYGGRHFVHFLGLRKNVRDYFAACDMGLMPPVAAEESCLSTVIDCLATGRPVLAAANGEMRDVLSADGELAGCLLEQRDWTTSVEALANTMILCAADRTHYARMKAAATAAHAKFDTDALLRGYINVYQTISRA
jgi:O-antigen biosynthesis protein